MAAQVTVTLRSNIELAVRRALEPELRALCTAVADDAWRLCPRDTGYLSSTIDVLGVDVDAGEGQVGATAHYARHVEEGTRRMAAQPYLRPAALRPRGRLR
jgi:hypothetical protein